MTIAAAQLGMFGSTRAQAGPTKQLPAIRPGTNTSFGALKQIDAGVLNVGYAEAGPTDGPAHNCLALLARREQRIAASASRNCAASSGSSQTGR
jgi:hypothetical protein